MTEPMFSIIVLCYRHFEYLFTAIDSVLTQDYPNIELITSDDGSADFPYKEIETYINARKHSNITRTIIRQQQENSGTVRHLNAAVKECAGEYIIALAGDDALAGTDTLSQYVQGFWEAPDNCYIEMAQTAMYGENLRHIEYYYAKPMVQEALRATCKSTDRLYQLLVQHSPCLPSTSTCFRKDFFSKFGEFNEEYSLVEDYPMHLRLAQEHWIIHYRDFVAIKHRHGGISHGQKNTLSRSAAMYFTDEKNMIEKLILAQINALPPHERSHTRNAWKKQLRWIDFTLALSQKKYLRVCCLALRHFGYIAGRLCNKANNWAEKWHVKMLMIYLALNYFSPVIQEMAEETFCVKPGVIAMGIHAVLWLTLIT